MSQIDAKISSIENLANQLITDHLVVKSENQKLKEHVALLKQSLDEQSQLLQKTQAELQRVRLARGLAGSPEEANQAKAKLGSLMREIDRCIALLNE
ncbi:MAG: hypothetical protein DA405_04970 [Bacteroidetes bacterium]|nr:MAG: hypothetical protein DA405_04970 [Bacteroidota bacterium]